MDKIITADTSTYHISDAFMIPTITIFTDNNYLKKIFILSFFNGDIII